MLFDVIQDLQDTSNPETFFQQHGLVLSWLYLSRKEVMKAHLRANGPLFWGAGLFGRQNGWIHDGCISRGFIDGIKNRESQWVLSSDWRLKNSDCRWIDVIVRSIFFSAIWATLRNSGGNNRCREYSILSIWMFMYLAFLFLSKKKNRSLPISVDKTSNRHCTAIDISCWHKVYCMS